MSNVYPYIGTYVVPATLGFDVPKLTKRVIDGLEPREKDYTVYDDGLPGFAIRVWPTGKKVFVLKYRMGKRQRRLTLGKYGVLTLEEARAAAKQALKAKMVGVDPATARDAVKQDMTVAELCDHYLAHGTAHKQPSTVENDRGNIERHIKPLIGRLCVRDVVPADIKRFRALVIEGKTAGTFKTNKPRGLARVSGGEGAARRATAFVSTLFRYAIEIGLREDNPAAGLPKGKDPQRDRFLSNEELDRLAAVLRKHEDAGTNPKAIAILRLLLLTGARRSEITNARWRYVDLERGVLTVPDGKTGRREIRLAPPAAQILADQAMVASSLWVFPAERGDGPFQGVSKIWRAIRKDAKLADVRIHDLRHTFASFAVGGGESLYVTQAILGHADPSMTQRYAHLSDDPVRLGTTRTAQRIADAMGIEAVVDKAAKDG